MDSFKIRRAEPKDAEAIARVRISGWKQSYAGIMPEALLDKLDVEADSRRVSEALSDKKNKSLRFVVESEGKIIGMGACGKAREAESPLRAEVYAIYLLEEGKRRGIGTSFMREMARVLEANGYESLQVRVLEQNATARRFYERLGGKLAGKGVFSYEGLDLPDVTYAWDDIRQIAAGSA
jgi:ribosomal protein S18 acetylase RimI-like enzyme